MASATTVYDIKVKYTVKDLASKKLRLIQRTSSDAAKNSEKLTRRLKMMNRELARTRNRASKAATAMTKVGRAGRRASRGGGRGVGLGIFGTVATVFGIQKATDATIGFNRSLEQTQAQLRTIIQLNTGRTFVASNKTAGVLMQQLREDAKASAGTFQDMVKFSAAIAGPVTRAGGTMRDLREVTKGAVVAAAAFGERADLAQLDITQALAGTLGAKDRFAKAILGPLNITAKEFNKMTAPERLNTLKEAFNQKGIKDAAKAFQTSFEGNFSTFVSNMQEFGGKVGSKLFARLNVELQRLNKWFGANERRVDEFADNLATGLVKAFKFAKKIFGFIIQHKALLLSLAKAFLISKGVGLVGGLIGGFTRGLSGATNALAALAAGASLAADAVLRRQERNIKTKVRKGSVLSAARDFTDPKNLARLASSKTFGGVSPSEIQKRQAESFLRRAEEAGIIKPGQTAIRGANEAGQNVVTKNTRAALKKLGFETGRSDTGQVIRALEAAMKFQPELTADRIDRMGIRLQNELIGLRSEAMSTGQGITDVMRNRFDAFLSKAFPARPDKASDAKTKDRKSQVKVGKMVIQVESNDPDRFALGLEGLFSDIAKNGAQAALAQRGF